MAHDKTAAWRWPGGESREIWKRRNIFLEAATNHAPALVDDLRTLQPLANEAIAAMQHVRWVVSRGLNWRNLDTHVSIMHDRQAATDHNPWLDGLRDPEQRRSVLELHEALPAWAQAWHLTTPEKSCFITAWVLEAAFGALLNATDDKPAQLHQLDFAFASPILPILPPFQAEPWSGDEPTTIWRKRWLDRFDAYLHDHIEEYQLVLSGGDLEPLPSMRSENVEHLQRAARWQVGGESWDDFLTREGLTDSKVSNVRAKTRAALRLIHIIERPGMRSV